jgi:two-component system, cell cycle response regulator
MGIENRRAGDNRSPAPQRPAPVGARILIVDDHPDNIIILRDRLVARGYATMEAHDGEEALRALGAFDEALPDGAALPDLILLDVMLPRVDGFEVARRIKASRSLPFIPIIIQTALDTTEDMVVGLDSGADDYITKPINFAELEARIRSLLRIKSLQEEVERQKSELSTINDQLVHIARTDALTGIDNRRRLEERLEEAFEHSRRLDEPFACVMCDLDMFKSVNDTYGHQAGDAVLRQFAQLLREQAREIDRVGRYGGEEFMLVLPGATVDAGVSFAERVRKAVEGRTFSFAGAVIRRTMSCGVASWPHPGIPDVPALVRATDDALYAAKAQGRNRVVRWDLRATAARDLSREGAEDTPGSGRVADDTSHDLRADDGEQQSSVSGTSYATERPTSGGARGGAHRPPDEDRGAAA